MVGGKNKRTNNRTMFLALQNNRVAGYQGPVKIELLKVQGYCMHFKVEVTVHENKRLITGQTSDFGQANNNESSNAWLNIKSTHHETDQSFLRSPVECFYCFKVFGTPDEAQSFPFFFFYKITRSFKIKF